MLPGFPHPASYPPGCGPRVGTWTHFAATRVVNSPTSHTYRFYLDGILVHTQVDTNPNLPDTDQDWTISGRGEGGTFLTGLLDEIRFYDEALDPSQFLNAAQAVPEPSTLPLLGISLTGLIGWGRRKRKA